MLSGIEKGLIGVLVLVLMAGMGATLNLGHFRDVLRQPRAVLIGMASQFWFHAAGCPLLGKAFATSGGARHGACTHWLHAWGYDFQSVFLLCESGRCA